MDCFGYDHDNIDTELRASGQRVDIALTNDGNVFAVIECKSSNLQIKQAAIDQAVNYATTLNANWAIVTNGQTWSLYHVLPVPGDNPDVVEIFTVDIFDEDGLSKDDISFLYLLTKKSMFEGETEINAHFYRATSMEYMFNILISDKVVALVTKELLKSCKKEYGLLFEGIDDDLVKSCLTSYLGFEE